MPRVLRPDRRFANNGIEAPSVVAVPAWAPPCALVLDQVVKSRTGASFEIGNGRNDAGKDARRPS
jgi:hypothetical protein